MAHATGSRAPLHRPVRTFTIGDDVLDEVDSDEEVCVAVDEVVSVALVVVVVVVLFLHDPHSTGHLDLITALSAADNGPAASQRFTGTREHSA